ncbi:MAG: class I SAM-dependent methyltransferase [Chthoniobacterales bacterium]
MDMLQWMEPDLHRAFAAEQTDALRLYTAPDGWVERYGVDVLISHKNDAALERMSTQLYLWTLNAGYTFRRIFARFLPKQNADRESPRLLLGDAGANLQTIATERMLRYGIDFSAGYSVGLFIDQRENRRFVRDLEPRSLLNCFAYTCSFSVTAASVGAQTVSVDLSKKSLARGRENFALNALPTNDHRFIGDDVMSVLPRLGRKGEKFDIIVLDPPTFSRSHKGKTFQVESDYETLLLAAIELIAREGHILVSTNCSNLDERALEVMARYCLKATRRAATFHREPALPDFPSRSGASTLWLKMR